MKKTKKRYYILVVKSSNKVYISTNKKLITSYTGLYRKIISRHLKHSDVYDTIHFTIWKDIPVGRKKTGFALHS